MMNVAKNLEISIGPVSFRNPVFIASGICGYGEEYSPFIDIESIGGVVTKTITVRPRTGNPPPRIHELPTGALNSIGLENVGLDVYIAEKLPALKSKRRPSITAAIPSLSRTSSVSSRNGYPTARCSSKSHRT
jgi:dihydroorotate dehydrogenase (NAD+) catalytic subunit